MEKVDAKILIYCLKHPTSQEIRYVGMTSRTLKQRLQGHIDNAKYSNHNKHLCNWILSILKLNMKPIIEKLDVATISNWKEKEIHYISIHKNLINATLGGEGSFGLKHTDETKEKLRLSKIGVRPSPETLLKRSISLKGRIVTKEHRDKIGLSNKGKVYTKYKILVTDLSTQITKECNSVINVEKIFNIPASTIRRNLNKNTIVKKKYILVKI